MAGKPFGLAVKAFVSDPQGRWLLVRRAADSKWYPGQWDLPGGKVDPGEEFDAALVREIAEETGLDVELEGLAGADEFEMPHVRVILLYMRARTAGGEVRLRAGEHEQAVWIQPKSIAEVDLSDQLRPFVLPYADSLRG
jgi:8-oxo-dGTP diphosphatase